MIKKVLYAIHRFSGIAISLLFLMWCVTGLVLIYHPFPNVTKQQVYEKMDVLSDNLPPIDSILAQLPAGEKSIKSIQLREYLGQSQFEIKTKEDKYTFSTDSSEVRTKLALSDLQSIASKWSDAPISKIDPLEQLEQWIMYSKYEKELPIYKVYFDDDKKHELYISSQTGDIQQFTDKDERFWAYLGFIPHTLYIPALRKNTETWILTITVLATIGLIACLSGAYVGIKAYRTRYKRDKKFVSPYKKKSFKWHHIFGLIFGIFLITWSVSGIISLRKVPQWITKTHHKIPSGIKGKQVGLDAYKFDYRIIKEIYPKVKRVEWSSFQGIPIYRAIIDDNEFCFDASSPQIMELYLSEEDIARSIRMNHGDSVQYSIKLIHEYEEYYLPWKRELILPAYKVEVNDADNSLYYINPKTGDYKYVNDNRRTRKWMFNGLHYFHIKWLVDRPVLWTIIVWGLSLGCIVVSATGVWIGAKYIKRKIRKAFRKKKCRKVKS